ncbi:hypothetical protein PS652_03650 [Pseudomonas fluorescens]|uniref:Uncharacterized protein n=1 Tax=Pseudomonas fluorescens TaxID=294 RepID=A0A5E6S9D1_PSEFL|nr:hypothetical protein PS652_01868 [Pseudomonas fluorescens]
MRLRLTAIAGTLLALSISGAQALETRIGEIGMATTTRTE